MYCARQFRGDANAAGCGSRQALSQQREAIRQEAAAGQIRTDKQAKGTPGERDRIADKADDSSGGASYDSITDNASFLYDKARDAIRKAMD